MAALMIVAVMAVEVMRARQPRACQGRGFSCGVFMVF